MSDKKISDATIKRLPIYLRFLERTKASNIKSISSNEIGNLLKFNPAQVRKDLSFFGDFGKKGFGYDVDHLILTIRKILQLDKEISVCIVGFGHLGHALCHYSAYQQDNMKIKAIFDKQQDKLGNEFDGIPIFNMNNLTDVIKEKNIKIGIITVPHEFAQEVANALIDAGVKAILNFAPITIHVPDEIKVHYADFTTELHSLAYFLEK